MHQNATALPCYQGNQYNNTLVNNSRKWLLMPKADQYFVGMLNNKLCIMLNSSLFFGEARDHTGLNLGKGNSQNTTKPASELKAVLECGIASYNCKNLNTSKHAIDKLSQNYDIILLQEHWLFDCQLHKLKEFHENYSGLGKAVNSDDPILPVQMPRGYGGVGILWKKDIDHLISVIPDGGTDFNV